MPHSQHGKDTTAKQKSRRSISHYSKGKQDKPKQRPNDAVKSQPITAAVSTNVQPPAEKTRPWSPWIPGDDGRWFYQGRLKADGSEFLRPLPPLKPRFQGRSKLIFWRRRLGVSVHRRLSPDIPEAGSELICRGLRYRYATPALRLYSSSSYGVRCTCSSTTTLRTCG